MTDMFSPINRVQTQLPIVSDPRSEQESNLNFRPVAQPNLSPQINVGDFVALKCESTANPATQPQPRFKVVGRSEKGDLIVIEDARLRSINGLDFRYILNISQLRELIVKQEKHMTDGVEVYQQMPGVHNFRYCPDLRVLKYEQVTLA